MAALDVDALAAYIFDWLKRRNGGELSEPLENMRVGDARLAHEELALILRHEGHPPNWQKSEVIELPAKPTTKHVTFIELNYESYRRGGTCRSAACFCGWKGPQRATIQLAYDDVMEHERWETDRG